MLGAYNGHPLLARYLWYVTLLFTAPVHPCSIKSFLLPFYRCHVHEKRYQALHVLRATKNGEGLGMRLGVYSNGSGVQLCLMIAQAYMYICFTRYITGELFLKASKEECYPYVCIGT